MELVGPRREFNRIPAFNVPAERMSAWERGSLLTRRLKVGHAGAAPDGRGCTAASGPDDAVLVIFLAMADRQNAMARCPFRRVSTVSDGVVRETTRRSGSKPGIQQPG